jgi:hypothetical protein
VVGVEGGIDHMAVLGEDPHHIRRGSRQDSRSRFLRNSGTTVEVCR